MLSDCRESTTEKPQSLGSSEDSHFESENPFGMRELETREHWYFQSLNLPQAKRLPCLEGKSERPKGKEQKWRSYCRRSGRPKIGTRRSRSGRIMLRRFLAAEDLRAFSALSSAWRIRLASSLASASSRWTYSSMVFQPNSDLSAKIINFYCLESIDVPSARDALAFSIALDSRWDFTSSRLSWSLAMNFYWILFPFCVKDFGSSCWIFLISRGSLSATPELDC